MRKSILALAVGGLLAGSFFAVAPASAETATIVTKAAPERVVVVKKKKPMVKKVVIHKAAPKKKVVIARAHSPNRSQVAIIKRD